MSDEASNRQLMVARKPSRLSPSKKATGKADMNTKLPPTAISTHAGTNTSKVWESARLSSTRPDISSTADVLTVTIGPKRSRKMPTGSEHSVRAVLEITKI